MRTIKPSFPFEIRVSSRLIGANAGIQAALRAKATSWGLFEWQQARRMTFWVEFADISAWIIFIRMNMRTLALFTLILACLTHPALSLGQDPKSQPSDENSTGL